jgi:hypothetical protein
MGLKHVKGVTTARNGCKVEIDGDVVYSLIPLRIQGFRGVIHLSGGPDCPNGDLFFDDKPEVSVDDEQEKVLELKEKN